MKTKGTSKSFDGNSYIILYLFVLLITVNFFSNRFVIDSVNMVTVKNTIGLLLFVFIIPVFFREKKPFFFTEIFLILLSLVCSAFSSEYLYHQEIFESFKPSMQVLLALSVYLLAYYLKLSELTVFKILMLCVIAYTLIEIIQQFTYPSYWFCGRIEKYKRDVLEIRMGFYRFVLDGIFYCVLFAMLIVSRLRKLIGEKTKNYLLFVIASFGIFFDLERKVIIPFFAILLICVVFQSRRTSSKYILLFVVFLVVPVLAIYMDSLNKQSLEEMNDPDFVRFLAMNYYANEMNTSFWYYVFGAGIPNNSSLGNLIDYMEETYHFFQEDVGVVGYMSKFGIFGIVPHVLIVLKIFRNRKLVDMELKLYLVMLIAISYFKFWGNYLPNYAAFMLYLYFVEKNIKNNKYLSSASKFVRTVKSI